MEMSDGEVAPPYSETAPKKKKVKVRTKRTTEVDGLSAEMGGMTLDDAPPPPPPLCPPANPRAKRTFANLGCDPSGDRFEKGDVCARCGHKFSRGMLKDYHFASKNCMNKTPYSATEVGKRGKVGEHAARKVRVADPAMASLVSEMKSWLKYAENDWMTDAYDSDIMYAMTGIQQFIGKYMAGSLKEVMIANPAYAGTRMRCEKTEDLVNRLAEAITVKRKTTTTVKSEMWVNGVKVENKKGTDEVEEVELTLKAWAEEMW